MKLLLIDDDSEIQLLIKKSINQLISLSILSDLPPLLKELEPYDLILLDLMLGDKSSLTFLNKIQESSPHLLGKIILITGAGSDDIELQTHQLGLRDYVKKPFNPKILSALLDKHLSQIKRTSLGTKYGPFFLNESEFKILADNQEIELTITEFKVLKLLILSRGRVVTRERLLTDVWNMNDEIQTRTVDMHMSMLRKKMGEHGKLLKTKRGIGYTLDEQ